VIAAVGTGALRLGGHAEIFGGQKLTGDVKVPVLPAYLRRWKAEVGISFEGYRAKLQRRPDPRHRAQTPGVRGDSCQFLKAVMGHRASTARSAAPSDKYVFLSSWPVRLTTTAESSSCAMTVITNPSRRSPASDAMGSTSRPVPQPSPAWGDLLGRAARPVGIGNQLGVRTGERGGGGGVATELICKPRGRVAEFTAGVPAVRRVNYRGMVSPLAV
jgi:hypothetical protein